MGVIFADIGQTKPDEIGAAGEAIAEFAPFDFTGTDVAPLIFVIPVSSIFDKDGICFIGFPVCGKVEHVVNIGAGIFGRSYPNAHPRTRDSVLDGWDV